MSKAVMISIRPKWCEKICRGEKTVEVRKGRPKMETPFKCYIYCTMDHPYISVSCGELDKLNYRTNTVGRCNGKVIGEFICDAIARVNICGFWDDSGKQLDNRLKETCLTSEELCDYLGEKVGYGWHISDLKIYDTLKELSKFSRPFENCIDKVCDEFGCESCENGGHIKRPPQSWCYVEEM